MNTSIISNNRSISRKGNILISTISKYFHFHKHPVEIINKAVRGAEAADIATNINGKVVHIKVLSTHIPQSPDQWKYRALVEQSGDLYVLARSFSDIFKIYSLLTNRQVIDYTKPARDENEEVAIMTNCQFLADLKAFYLCNSKLIDASLRARNCYIAQRALIPFKNRQHG